MLTRQNRLLILGDWITQFSYVVWDGDHLLMQQYIEGESQL
jgi:UDP-2,3-diacylglucosamine hydrolase